MDFVAVVLAVGTASSEVISTGADFRERDPITPSSYASSTACCTFSRFVHRVEIQQAVVGFVVTQLLLKTSSSRTSLTASASRDLLPMLVYLGSDGPSVLAHVKTLSFSSCFCVAGVVVDFAFLARLGVIPNLPARLASVVSSA